MHISNRFVIACIIETVIRMLKTLIKVLRVWIPGLFNGKIGSCLQIALFLLFYQNFYPPNRFLRPSHLFDLT